MEILDLVDYVNTKLKYGFSTAKIEKEMQLGKDTLRKKLNRAGYKYNKALNVYEKVDTITSNNSLGYSNITQTNTVSYKNKSDVYNTKEEIKKNGDTEIMDIKFTNKKNKIDKKENLSNEEIKFIKMLYSQYQKNIDINNIEIDEIIVRSIRVSKNAMDLFSNHCKKNNLNQTKALTKALLNFIENN